MMSNNPDDRTRFDEKALNEQRERYLSQLQGDDSAASHPPDRTESSARSGRVRGAVAPARWMTCSLVSAMIRSAQTIRRVER